MKIFVITSVENNFIAEKMLADAIGAIPVHSYQLQGKAGSISFAERREMIQADCFLPIVDSKFLQSTDLMLELKTALDYTHKLKKPIYPVLLGDFQIPEELENQSCIRIDGTPDSILSAKEKIEKICARGVENTAYLTKKSDNTSSRLLIAAIILLSLSILLFYLGKFLRAAPFLYVIPALTGFLGVISFVLYFLRLNDERRQRSYRDEYIYLQKLEEKIVSENPPSSAGKGKPNSAPKKNEINALGFMTVNLSNIEKYYKWSTKQARMAFGLALGFCISGLLIFAMAVLLPTVFKTNIGVAIITAIAGGIVELFAGTALVVYKSSVEQLNYYHKALHEDERFLSSVNLLGEFSTTDKKDEVLHEIIKSEISMNTMAYDDTAQSTKQKNP